MKIIRSMPESGWVPVANTAARDHRLTWKARGLLCELLSYPDGWETSVDKLVEMAQGEGCEIEGRDAMRAAMKELLAYGYAQRVRIREAGRWGTAVTVTDYPASVEPASACPAPVEPASVDPSLLRRRTTKTDTKKDLKKTEDKRSSSSGRTKEAARIMSVTGATEDEASLILKRIETENVIEKSLGAYMKGIPDADLMTYLDDIRSPKPPAFTDQGRIEFARRLQGMARCEHGTHGGHVPYPPTGWVACAMERNRVERLPHDGRRVATEAELDGWKPHPTTAGWTA